MKNKKEFNQSLNDFSHFIFGSNRNLNQIIRFNTRQKTFNETVASHIFFVSLYAMIMGDILKNNGHKIDMELLLKKALLHDIEETLSGDIVRTFKIKMKKAYQKMSLLSASYVLEKLPKNLKNSYLSIWKDKSIRIETLIVDIADELTGIIYCSEQLKMSNKFFEQILEGYCKNLYEVTKDTLLAPLYPYITNLLRTHHLHDYDNY